MAILTTSKNQLGQFLLFWGEELWLLTGPFLNYEQQIQIWIPLFNGAKGETWPRSFHMITIPKVIRKVIVLRRS
ncbi:hypothetical protein A165_04070 [Vibrio tasmaniensis ZS-17]|nr:hypothetical protein A165_04070 [Vibrio tasmaniensis ZS-17]